MSSSRLAESPIEPSLSVPPVAGRGRRKIAARAALLVLMATSGCSNEKFAPACPALSLLKDAADISRFGPGGRDVTDMVLDGRITGVPASCRPDGPDRVKATVHVNFDLTRGPAANSRRTTVPYFIGVTRDGQVLDKQDYVLAAEFPANSDRAVVSSADVELVFPVTQARSAAAYTIYVGFALDAGQLAYNRQRGSR